MSSLRLFASSIVLLLLCGATVALSQSNKLVTGGSVGPIKVGMKISEARSLMKGYKFERSSDGEGIPLVLVSKSGKSFMTIYDGEENQDTKKINSNNLVQQIFVWDPAYKTSEGIGAETLISDAEKAYGKLKEIMMSEIEAREYATFAKKLKGIDFRVEGSGVYPKGSNKTSMYRKTGKISGLVVSGDGTEENVGFFSEYTDLVNDCKTPNNTSDGGHVQTTCNGPGNYRVAMFDTAKTYQIQVRSGNTRRFVNLATESLSWSPKGKKIEWRFKYGEPFAVIFRANTYQKDEDGTIKYPAVITGQHLVIKGLPGYNDIDGKVNTKMKDANYKAREIADKGYAAMQRAKNGKAFLEIDTGDYNVMIIAAKAKGESWVSSPMQTALKIVNEFSEMKTRTMKFEAPMSEGFETFKLTVMNDGLMDDSVAADKYEFSFLWEDETWRVSSARRSWKCWEGRGHQDYSAVPCN